MPWYHEAFDEDYLRSYVEITPEVTRQQVDLMEALLGLDRDSRVLDLCCGQGRHLIEFLRRGYRVVGLDLSAYLLGIAQQTGVDQRVPVRLVRGDMRWLPFPEAFDAVFTVFTSFGYFDEVENAGVLSEIARVIKPGGRLLIEVTNRDYLLRVFQSRRWGRGRGLISLDENTFDYVRSQIRTHHTIIRDDGTRREYTSTVRVYSLHEMLRLLEAAGFTVLEVCDGKTRGVFDGLDSHRMAVVGEKR